MGSFHWKCTRSMWSLIMVLMSAGMTDQVGGSVEQARMQQVQTVVTKKVLPYKKWTSNSIFHAINTMDSLPSSWFSNARTTGICACFADRSSTHVFLLKNAYFLQADFQSVQNVLGSTVTYRMIMEDLHFHIINKIWLQLYYRQWAPRCGLDKFHTRNVAIPVHPEVTYVALSTLSRRTIVWPRPKITSRVIDLSKIWYWNTVQLRRCLVE